MRKRVAMTAAIAVLVGLLHAVPVAQERIDQTMIEAIKAEDAARFVSLSGEGRNRDCLAHALTSTGICKTRRLVPRIAVYLNDDPGTGATYGFYMEENPAAKAIFDAWLEPLRDLGSRAPAGLFTRP
jgi:hypothetical protein